MMITTKDMFSSGGAHIDLPVVVSGMGITVGAGAFRVLRSDFELDEDVSVTIPTETEKLIVYGHLVQDVATEEITMLYDVMLPGEAGYLFDRNGPYRLLHRFLIATIPENTVDLDAEGVNITVYRIMQRVGEV